MRRTCCWVLGIITGVVLIGHSVMMLDAAHPALRSPSAPYHPVGLHDAPMWEGAVLPGPIGTVMDQHPAQHELDGCDVVLPAAPRRDDTAPEPPSLISPAGSSVQAAQASVSIGSPDTLCLPSRVRRALLQVYRI